MDLNNELNKKGKEKKGTKGLYRVVISKEANKSLEEIVDLVNNDFSCGEITKSNVAEWILTSFKGSLPKADIKKIQESYIDEKKLLQDLLKGSTNTNSDIPPEISKALKAHFGFSSKQKKVS